MVSNVGIAVCTTLAARVTKETMPDAIPIPAPMVNAVYLWIRSERMAVYIARETMLSGGVRARCWLSSLGFPKLKIRTVTRRYC
jgi:hypothetical protein